MKEQVVIGKIVAPHGVRGEFRIKPLTDNPEQFLQLEYLMLEGGTILHLVGARFHKNVVLVQAKEINTMDEAEALRGKNVLINTADLPPLPQGRYYVADLVGFAVYNEANEVIGSLSDVITTGSTDVFVVQTTQKQEIMIPAIVDYIKSIDIQERAIHVVVPKWAD